MQAELNDVTDELLVNRTELEEAREDLMRTLSERALADQAKRDAPVVARPSGAPGINRTDGLQHRPRYGESSLSNRHDR